MELEWLRDHFLKLTLKRKKHTSETDQQRPQQNSIFEKRNRTSVAVGLTHF